MEEHKFKLYDGKVWGVKVSDYGLENGYLDYLTLSKLVGDCILNNSLIENCYWDVVTGNSDDDIYQFYIISEAGYEFLSEYTDEIVFYNEDLDLYLWGITHFGTSWDYVLTNIKIY